MNVNIVRNALLDCREIEDILCFERQEYQGKMYDVLVECQLIAGRECVPLRIGINEDWPINLFDFYVHHEDSVSKRWKEIVPHVDIKGKICLCSLDSVLIDDQFEGLLQECVKKVAKIITVGTSGINKEDLLWEFHAYWRELPDLIFARLFVPPTESNVILKWGTENNVAEKYRIIAALSSDALDEWSIGKSQLRNAAFFSIDATNKVIFPPNPTKPDLASFLEELLDYIEGQTQTRVLGKLKTPYILFFHIRQLHNHWADIGFRLDSKDNLVEIIKQRNWNQLRLKPIFVRRIDREYLMQRVVQQTRPLESLQFLLIGAGSIGGYFADFLGKAGGRKVAIVDNECLLEVNIFRHLLGKIFVPMPKADAICKYMAVSLPGLSYTPIHMTIEEAYKKRAITWEDFDVIIAATGNENVNRWLEKKLQESSAKCKVIYLWNEPLDIGCHAACVDMQLPGRYGNMFQYDDNRMLTNVASFAAPNQRFEWYYGGCDGSFMPYGSEVSIQAALLGMDLLKKSVSGILKKNVIISYKGDGIYFRAAGFKVSDAYDLQAEKVNVVNLENYRG